MYEPKTRAKLTEGEELIARFDADRATYIRDHVVMAAVLAVGAMVVLQLMGEVWWVGAPAALLAIGVRAFYLASDDLTAYWELTDQRLLGPQGRAARLAEIKELRTLGSAVRIITDAGDKHLMKYLADKNGTRDQIERHMAGGRG